MKTPIRRLDSLTHNDTAATKLINDNFEALQQGVEDALSRSGKKPNFMDDVLDMNMHRIINIADPIDDYDLANKHYVDTKVSEEETRAKAAEDAINDILATYGNIVTHNVSEFATAAQGAKADTAVQPTDLGNGTLTITQGGATKGTFTANQKTNATINLDASNNTNTQLKNLTFELAEGFTHFAYDITHSSSSTKKYFPIVIVNDTLVEHIAPTCTFDGRYVDFEYDGTEITATGNEIILIEITDGSNPVSGVTNGTMGIQASGSDTGIIYLHNVLPIYIGTQQADINVSSYVEDDKNYFPIVTTSHDIQIESGRNGLQDCSYVPATKNVVLRYTDNTYQRTYNVVYDVRLIPVSEVESENPFYGFRGITDGFCDLQTKDNLVTSISGSSTDVQYPSAKCVYDALQNAGGLPNPVVTRVPTFSGTTKGYIDVSDLTEVGDQYIPIVTTSSSTSVSGSSITEACKNLKSQCEYDYTNRRIILDYTDNTYVNTNHFSYSFILIPQQSGGSTYVYGITDGLNGYLNNAQTTGNLVASISSSSTDAQYPSAKCVYDIVGDVETLINAL